MPIVAGTLVNARESAGNSPAVICTVALTSVVESGSVISPSTSAIATGISVVVKYAVEYPVPLALPSRSKTGASLTAVTAMVAVAVLVSKPSLTTML